MKDIPMIVELFDRDAGTRVFINPDYVLSLRPDPEDPHGTTSMKLRDGELVRIVGESREVAGKLSTATV